VSSDSPQPPAQTPEQDFVASKVLELDSTQRRYLRSLAHPLKPIVFVGEGGISPAVTKALDEALTSHELVKVRLRQPKDKKAAARELAEAGACALCGVVGHIVVLYRPHPEEPRIKLPKRD
jgi:RNA-binding protein